MPNREIAAFYNSPKPRQEWVDNQFIQNSEDEEAWVELFIDLVYVVLLSKLGDLLASCMHASPYFGFKIAVIFAVMCMTRQSIDEYANRFYSHDLAHKLIYLVYTLGVFIQVLNISIGGHGSAGGDTGHVADDHGVDDHGTVDTGHRRLEELEAGCKFESVFGLGFFIGVLVTRCSLLLIYMLVISNNKRAQEQFIFDMSRFALTSAIMIVGIILSVMDLSSDTIDTLLLCACVVQELCVWVTSRMKFRQKFTYPIDLDLMQGRWGTWVMIVIGEAVIQMLYQQVNRSLLRETYAFCIISIILMFSLAMQYYDACQCEWYNHALTKSAMAGVSWIWLHVPMSLFLFGVGASLKSLIHSLQTGVHVSPYNAQVFCVSLGLCTFIMTLIRLTNTTLNICKLRRNDKIMYSTRVVFSCLQLSVAYWSQGIHPTNLVGIEMGWSLGLNALDILYDIYLNPNNKVKRVFALSTAATGGASRKSNLQMNAMSSKSINFGNGNNNLRRPSRPFYATNLMRARSEKSEYIPSSTNTGGAAGAINNKPSSRIINNYGSSRVVPVASDGYNVISYSANSNHSNHSNSGGREGVGMSSNVPGVHQVYQAPRNVTTYRRNSKTSDHDLSSNPSVNRPYSSHSISANASASANAGIGQPQPPISSAYNVQNISNHSTGSNNQITTTQNNSLTNSPNNDNNNNANNPGNITADINNNTAAANNNNSNNVPNNSTATLIMSHQPNNANNSVSISNNWNYNHNNNANSNTNANPNMNNNLSNPNYNNFNNNNSGSYNNSSGWNRTNSNSVSMHVTSITRGFESAYNAAKNAVKGAASRIQSEISEISQSEHQGLGMGIENDDEMDMNAMWMNKTLQFDGFGYRFVDCDPFDIEHREVAGDLEDSAEYLANYTADLVGESVGFSSNNNINISQHNSVSYQSQSPHSYQSPNNSNASPASVYSFPDPGQGGGQVQQTPMRGPAEGQQHSQGQEQGQGQGQGDLLYGHTSRTDTTGMASVSHVHSMSADPYALGHPLSLTSASVGNNNPHLHSGSGSLTPILTPGRVHGHGHGHGQGYEQSNVAVLFNMASASNDPNAYGNGGDSVVSFHDSLSIHQSPGR